MVVLAAVVVLVVAVGVVSRVVVFGVDVGGFAEAAASENEGE